ncbi:MAG TPA: DUF2269 domain-containing protein [Parvularculaceae bacterium]|nr:DUF2269 domain-containing protein [Parvularculaceae bacterium]HNS85562.1 DUF2269 domain-containing protein [Parvularculaceae bacterium]
MSLYFFLKWLHVIGAAVLLGAGAGIAFFMLRAHLTRDPKIIAAVASIVVLADYVFTLTAIIAQPVTGVALSLVAGYPLTSFWIIASIALYFFTGAFWVPVVFMQKKMRDLAREAADADLALPSEYFRLYRRWFAFGFPAFFAVLAIFWLMIARPTIG